MFNNAAGLDFYEFGETTSNVNDPTQAVIFRNGVYLTHGAINVAPSVPEPSTWAMMILGFAGVGFMAYRRLRGLVSRHVIYFVQNIFGRPSYKLSISPLVLADHR